MDPAKTIPLEGRGDDLLRFGIHGVKSDIIEPHPLQSARRSVMFQQFYTHIITLSPPSAP